MVYGNKYLNYGIVNEFKLFNKSKSEKDKCPIDKETRDKIVEAVEKSAKEINTNIYLRLRR